MTEPQISDPQWRQAYSIIRAATIPGHETTPEAVMRDALQAHLWLSANRRHWSELPASIGERAALSPVVTALQDAGILTQLTALMRTALNEEHDPIPDSAATHDSPTADEATEDQIRIEPEAKPAGAAETDAARPEPAEPKHDNRPDHAREAYPTPPPFPKTDLRVIRALEEWVAYFHHNLYEKHPEPNELNQLSHFYRVLDMIYAAAEQEIGPIQRRIFPVFPQGKVMERAQRDDAVRYTLTWMQSDLHDFARQVSMISNLLDHHQFPDPTLPAGEPLTTSDLGKLHLEPITDRDLENHAKRWAKEHDSGVVPQALATSLCRTNYPDVNEVHLQSNLERVLDESPFFGDPDGDVYPPPTLDPPPPSSPHHPDSRHPPPHRGQHARHQHTSHTQSAECGRYPSRCRRLGELSRRERDDAGLLHPS